MAVCDMMDYGDPSIEASDLEILVIDENTAIPYVLLGYRPPEEQQETEHQE